MKHFGLYEFVFTSFGMWSTGRRLRTILLMRVPPIFLHYAAYALPYHFGVALHSAWNVAALASVGWTELFSLLNAIPTTIPALPSA